VVNVAFYLATAAMITFALFLIVRPLIREGLHTKQSLGLFVIASAVTVLLPGIAIYLYTLLGTPAALDDQVVRGTHVRSNALPAADVLNSRVQQTQQNIQKWMQMAHAYDTQKRANEARGAYEQVLMIDANNTAAMVGWVEADMAQHADYAIGAHARQLLEQAIALEPDNQRALWLVGISDFQQRDYAEASATWRHLQRLLDSGSALAPSVAQQIAIADAKAKTPPAETLLQ
jgi:cytochrome c-type biogenesis protein CcmH